ncbi:MAG: hypothetical protein AAF330_02045 [Pseudomonadota bacterium]
MKVRLFIVGTSHAVAVRLAHERVMRRFPDLDVTYFAATAGLGFNLSVSADGVLSCPGASERDLARLKRINGASSVDLTPATHIWNIGSPFRFGVLQRLFRYYRVFGMGPTENHTVVSWAFTDEATDELVRMAVENLLEVYGPDQRLTVTPAPYPAAMSLKHGPCRDLPGVALGKLAYVDEIERSYESKIAASVESVPWRFLPQPAETRARAFLTKDEYLANMPATPLEAKDLRHMGADYGAILFEQYLTQIVGLKPVKKTAQA